jgi:hypothetical protein
MFGFVQRCSVVHGTGIADYLLYATLALLLVLLLVFPPILHPTPLFLSHTLVTVYYNREWECQTITGSSLHPLTQYYNYIHYIIH